MAYKPSMGDKANKIAHRLEVLKSKREHVPFVFGGVIDPSKKSLPSDLNAKCKSDDCSIESLSNKVFNLDISHRGLELQPLGYRSNTSNTVMGDFAEWEAHTKGIGTKLLMKMGYQPGKGLGKELQGISAPVISEPRKGRGALGSEVVQAPPLPVIHNFEVGVWNDRSSPKIQKPIRSFKQKMKKSSGSVRSKSASPKKQSRMAKIVKSRVLSRSKASKNLNSTDSELSTLRAPS